MSSKVYSLDDISFKDLIANSNSYSDCLRFFGLSTKGGSSLDVLKRRINNLDCDTSHFNKNYTGRKNVKALSDILIEGSDYANMSRLKIRLLKEKLIEERCYCCGISEWMNKPLSLQIHHKNGINTDHRINNLCLLCPNCHSQTDSYCGRNKGI